jgi:hypothetical protein
VSLWDTLSCQALIDRQYVTDKALEPTDTSPAAPIGHRYFPYLFLFVTTWVALPVSGN